MAWIQEVDEMLRTYRQDSLKSIVEPLDNSIIRKSLDETFPGWNDDYHEESITKMFLYRVEEEIRSTKRLIRRCRTQHAWTKNIIQVSGERWEDICFDIAEYLDAQHRYEKALQRYKRRLARYERLKITLREKINDENIALMNKKHG